MIDFDLNIKTKLYFGPNKEKMVGTILKEQSFKNVLIVIGQSSVKKSGLLDIVISSLEENNIKHSLLEGVRPNPRLIWWLKV